MYFVHFIEIDNVFLFLLCIFYIYLIFLYIMFMAKRQNQNFHHRSTTEAQCFRNSRGVMPSRSRNSWMKWLA